jgi:hypothetical protein
VRTTRISVLIVVVILGASASGRSEPDRVDIQSWQLPQTGWLYVIDATTAKSRIFLFDPERREVAGTIRTGYNPDVAISPRGDRVYVASEHVPIGDQEHGSP